MWLACSGGCASDPGDGACGRATARSMGCEADAGDAGSEVDRSPEAGTERDAGPTPEQDAAAEAGFDAAMDGAVEVPHDGSAHDGSAPDAAPEGSAPDGSASDGSAPREPQVLPLQGDLGVHDPTIIESNGQYIIFSTGPGVRVKRSSDLITWEDDGSVFSSNPAWVAQEVPGATHLWAPDIAYFNGQYHLYYSASTFGSRDSCIGHATASDLSTLDFEDLGPVVCSKETDDYNAIDPGFVVDESGTAWLSFGSFWSGVKLIRLDATGQRDGTDIYSLASRDAVGAIEAPYLVWRGGYYYLFVSFDLCCSGTASTYRIMVGRSRDVTGPYVDANGKRMLSAGGGSTVVLGDLRMRGPGHNAVLTVGEDQYLVYHAYDADHGGAATLRIAELLWDSAGWPLRVGP